MSTSKKRHTIPTGCSSAILERIKKTAPHVPVSEIRAINRATRSVLRGNQYTKNYDHICREYFRREAVPSVASIHPIAFKDANKGCPPQHRFEDLRDKILAPLRISKFKNVPQLYEDFVLLVDVRIHEVLKTRATELLFGRNPDSWSDSEGEDEPLDSFTDDYPPSLSEEDMRGHAITTTRYEEHRKLRKVSPVRSPVHHRSHSRSPITAAAAGPSSSSSSGFPATTSHRVDSKVGGGPSVGAGGVRSGSPTIITKRNGEEDELPNEFCSCCNLFKYSKFMLCPINRAHYIHPILGNAAPPLICETCSSTNPVPQHSQKQDVGSTQYNLLPSSGGVTTTTTPLAPHSTANSVHSYRTTPPPTTSTTRPYPPRRTQPQVPQQGGQQRTPKATLKPVHSGNVTAPSNNTRSSTPHGQSTTPTFNPTHNRSPQHDNGGPSPLKGSGSPTTTTPQMSLTQLLASKETTTTVTTTTVTEQPPPPGGAPHQGVLSAASPSTTTAVSTPHHGTGKDATSPPAGVVLLGKQSIGNNVSGSEGLYAGEGIGGGPPSSPPPAVQIPHIAPSNHQAEYSPSQPTTAIPPQITQGPQSATQQPHTTAVAAAPVQEIHHYHYYYMGEGGPNNNKTGQGPGGVVPPPLTGGPHLHQHQHHGLMIGGGGPVGGGGNNNNTTNTHFVNTSGFPQLTNNSIMSDTPPGIGGGVERTNASTSPIATLNNHQLIDASTSPVSSIQGGNIMNLPQTALSTIESTPGHPHSHNSTAAMDKISLQHSLQSLHPSHTSSSSSHPDNSANAGIVQGSSLVVATHNIPQLQVQDSGNMPVLGADLSLTKLSSTGSQAHHKSEADDAITASPATIESLLDSASNAGLLLGGGVGEAMHVNNKMGNGLIPATVMNIEAPKRHSQPSHTPQTDPSSFPSQQSSHSSNSSGSSSTTTTTTTTIESVHSVHKVTPGSSHSSQPHQTLSQCPSSGHGSNNQLVAHPSEGGALGASLLLLGGGGGSASSSSSSDDNQPPSTDAVIRQAMTSKCNRVNIGGHIWPPSSVPSSLEAPQPLYTTGKTSPQKPRDTLLGNEPINLPSSIPHYISPPSPLSTKPERILIKPPDPSTLTKEDILTAQFTKPHNMHLASEVIDAKDRELEKRQKQLEEQLAEAHQKLIQALEQQQHTQPTVIGNPGGTHHQASSLPHINLNIHNHVPPSPPPVIHTTVAAPLSNGTQSPPPFPSPSTSPTSPLQLPVPPTSTQQATNDQHVQVVTGTLETGKPPTSCASASPLTGRHTITPPSVQVESAYTSSSSPPITPPPGATTLLQLNSPSIDLLTSPQNTALHSLTLSTETTPSTQGHALGQSPTACSVVEDNNNTNSATGPHVAIPNKQTTSPNSSSGGSSGSSSGHITVTASQRPPADIIGTPQQQQEEGDDPLEFHSVKSGSVTRPSAAASVSSSTSSSPPTQPPTQDAVSPSPPNNSLASSSSKSAAAAGVQNTTAEGNPQSPKYTLLPPKVSPKSDLGTQTPTTPPANVTEEMLERHKELQHSQEELEKQQHKLWREQEKLTQQIKEQLLNSPTSPSAIETSMTVDQSGDTDWQPNLKEIEMQILLHEEQRLAEQNRRLKREREELKKVSEEAYAWACAASPKRPFFDVAPNTNHKAEPVTSKLSATVPVGSKTTAFEGTPPSTEASPTAAFSTTMSPAKQTTPTTHDFEMSPIQTSVQRLTNKYNELDTTGTTMEGDATTTMTMHQTTNDISDVSNDSSVIAQHLVEGLTVYTTHMSPSMKEKGDTHSLITIFDSLDLTYSVVDLTYHPNLTKQKIHRCSGIDILPQAFVSDIFIGTADSLKTLHKEGRLWRRLADAGYQAPLLTTPVTNTPTSTQVNTTTSTNTDATNTLHSGGMQHNATHSDPGRTSPTPEHHRNANNSTSSKPSNFSMSTTASGGSGGTTSTTHSGRESTGGGRMGDGSTSASSSSHSQSAGETESTDTSTTIDGKESSVDEQGGVNTSLSQSQPLEPDPVLYGVPANTGGVIDFNDTQITSFIGLNTTTTTTMATSPTLTDKPERYSPLLLEPTPSDFASTQQYPSEGISGSGSGTGTGYGSPTASYGRVSPPAAVVGTVPGATPYQLPAHGYSQLQYTQQQPPTTAQPLANHRPPLYPPNSASPPLPPLPVGGTAAGGGGTFTQPPVVHPTTRFSSPPMMPMRPGSEVVEPLDAIPSSGHAWGDNSSSSGRGQNDSPTPMHYANSVSRYPHAHHPVATSASQRTSSPMYPTPPGMRGSSSNRYHNSSHNISSNSGGSGVGELVETATVLRQRTPLGYVGRSESPNNTTSAHSTTTTSCSLNNDSLNNTTTHHVSYSEAITVTTNSPPRQGGQQQQQGSSSSAPIDSSVENVGTRQQPHYRHHLNTYRHPAPPQHKWSLPSSHPVNSSWDDRASKAVEGDSSPSPVYSSHTWSTREFPTPRTPLSPNLGELSSPVPGASQASSGSSNSSPHVSVLKQSHGPPPPIARPSSHTIQHHTNTNNIYTTPIINSSKFNKEEEDREGGKKGEREGISSSGSAVPITSMGYGQHHTREHFNRGFPGTSNLVPSNSSNSSSNSRSRTPTPQLHQTGPGTSRVVGNRDSDDDVPTPTVVVHSIPLQDDIADRGATPSDSEHLDQEMERVTEQQQLLMEKQAKLFERMRVLNEVKEQQQGGDNNGGSSTQYQKELQELHNVADKDQHKYTLHDLQAKEDRYQEEQKRCLAREYAKQEEILNHIAQQQQQQLHHNVGRNIPHHTPHGHQQQTECSERIIVRGGNLPPSPTAHRRSHSHAPHSPSPPLRHRSPAGIHPHAIHPNLRSRTTSPPVCRGSPPKPSPIFVLNECFKNTERHTPSPPAVGLPPSCRNGPPNLTVPGGCATPPFNLPSQPRPSNLPPYPGSPPRFGRPSCPPAPQHCMASSSPIDVLSSSFQQY